VNASALHAYGLFHIENGRFLCAQRNGEDYLICFSTEEAAKEFREALGVQEHCDIIGQTLDMYPFQAFYLDEEFVEIECRVV